MKCKLVRFGGSLSDIWVLSREDKPESSHVVSHDDPHEMNLLVFLGLAQRATTVAVPVLVEGEFDI